MSEPNAASRTEENGETTSTGETRGPSDAESNPDNGTVGTGVSEEPKGTDALDVEL